MRTVILLSVEMQVRVVFIYGLCFMFVCLFKRTKKKFKKKKNLGEVSELLAVYHLQKVSRKTVWKVNGTELFVSFQWKIPGSYGTSETVVCFPGRSVPNGKSCFICSNPYLIQVSYFLGPFFGKRNWLVQMETQFQNEIYQPWIFLPRFPKPLLFWKHNTQYYGNSLRLQTWINTLSRFQSLSSNCTVLHPPC